MNKLNDLKNKMMENTEETKENKEEITFKRVRNYWDGLEDSKHFGVVIPTDPNALVHLDDTTYIAYKKQRELGQAIDISYNRSEYYRDVATATENGLSHVEIIEKHTENFYKKLNERLEEGKQYFKEQRKEELKRLKQQKLEIQGDK